MKKYVYTYTKAATSAKNLAKELGYEFIDKTEIDSVPDGSLVVNWGSSGMSKKFASRVKIINQPEAVSVAVNKIDTFNHLKAAGVPHVPYTLSFLEAFKWGGLVCCRSSADGADGEGLTIVDTEDHSKYMSYSRCPLFTKYTHAVAEYRVNTTIDLCVGVQKKVQADGETIKDDKIKTSGNGYGFHLCSSSEIPFGLRPVAKEAIKALGLDFGGVDIIQTADGKYLVLEVNTAPHLTPSMVKGYADQIRAMYA